MAYVESITAQNETRTIRDLNGQQMLATVEASTTASKAYAVGDYLIANDKLYKVTTAIASGGTITVGTNVAEAKVGTELSELNRQISDLTESMVDVIEEEYAWNFSTTTYAGILKTIRASAKQTEHAGKLESVTLGLRNTSTGIIKLLLIEIVGTTATVYASINLTVHSNPDINNVYTNGVDFEYTGTVRKNTVFGVWADHNNAFINYGTETVRSYGSPTETPDNFSFSAAVTYAYNVAIGHKITVYQSKKKNIIVMGDSWTDIVNTSFVRWPVLLNNMPEFNVTSYGYTGSTIAGNVTNQVTAFLTEQPDADVVIMMGGINDYRGGTAYTNLVTSITNYYEQIKTVYPYVRFIYIANNQLYYSAQQLNYFNTIVKRLNLAGIEAYVSFAWVNPNQYAADFLHPGNAGNKLIAENIYKILIGGKVETVWTKYHWDIFENDSRIAQFNIFEFFDNGYPKIEIRGVASNLSTGKTFTKTINTLDMFVSAPWAVLLHAFTDATKQCVMYTPITETLDEYHQCTSFDLSITITNGGLIYTSSGNALMYENN